MGRLRAAIHVLLGRPVAYRVLVFGGLVAKADDRLLVKECVLMATWKYDPPALLLVED